MPGQKGEFMFDQNKLKESIVCLVLAFLFCAPAFAQQQADRQRKTSEQGRNDYGGEKTPRLAHEKPDRGSASAGQNGSGFGREEGARGGFERWGGEEARDRGQGVDDSYLTGPTQLP